jgi:hypothetical protein
MAATIADGAPGPLPEFEEEFELEGEFEYEDESEEFYRRLTVLARRAAQSPALRRIALTTARSVLGGAGGMGQAAGGPPSEGEYASEYEEEGEEEGEWESRLHPMHPMRRVPPVVVMEHLGHAAAEAESEAEAEAFIGALIPLAARLLPRAASVFLRAAPQLIRGAARVSRTLRRDPATRPLVRAVPTIVRRTAADVARQAAQGRPVTPRAAVRTLARQTASVLSNPQQCVRAYRRSKALDRQFHRAARGAAVAVPTAGPMGGR